MSDHDAVEWLITMAWRTQRHMDGAWEVRGRRQVLGFFVVEGAADNGLEVPATGVQAARATLSPTAIEGSFPHRSAAERDGIISGFLGVTTWQSVCASFEVEYASLPNEVAPNGEHAPR